MQGARGRRRGRSRRRGRRRGRGRDGGRGRHWDKEGQGVGKGGRVVAEGAVRAGGGYRAMGHLAPHRLHRGWKLEALWQAARERGGWHQGDNRQQRLRWQGSLQVPVQVPQQSKARQGRTGTERGRGSRREAGGPEERQGLARGRCQGRVADRAGGQVPEVSKARQGGVRAVRGAASTQAGGPGCECVCSHSVWQGEGQQLRGGPSAGNA